MGAPLAQRDATRIEFIVDEDVRQIGDPARVEEPPEEGIVLGGRGVERVATDPLQRAHPEHHGRMHEGGVPPHHAGDVLVLGRQSEDELLDALLIHESGRASHQ